MYEKKIKFTGYDGVEREQSFFFNLNESELLEMQLTITGGFVGHVERIIAAKDQPTLMKLFKELILKSYGEKDPDGIHFNKIDPVTGRSLAERFAETEAYSKLYVELATDDNAASDFVNKVIPEDLAEKLKEQEKQKQEQGNVQLPTA